MRGRARRDEDWQPLVDAIEADGGEWPAGKVQEFLGIGDKRNLARAMKWPMERGLFHRRRAGPLSFYLSGPAPDAIDAAGDFMPVLYGDDGTVALFNCPTDQDGRPVLNRAQASRLKALLNGGLIP